MCFQTSVRSDGFQSACCFWLLLLFISLLTLVYPTYSSPVKEISVLCHLSASELVEEWIAHATSAGCNQEPTLITLGEFERKVSQAVPVTFTFQAPFVSFGALRKKACDHNFAREAISKDVWDLINNMHDSISRQSKLVQLGGGG